MEIQKDNNRIGETRTMNCGETAEIVEYNGCMDITVKFENTGELVKCQYGHFKSGKVKSHFTPTVFGVGITGLEPIRDRNGKQLKSYDTWQSMLQRCYDEKLHERYPTYIDCSVDKEWLFYPNFKEWFDNNYYEIEGQTMNLDKDILYKGNKVYSPDNCVFVPQNINKLFIKCDATRGDLPIGIHLKDDKYKVRCQIFNTETEKSKSKFLGHYTDINKAFQVYKQAKEDNIKTVAEYYKSQIPEKLYNAMINYEVEITD